ncbi:MAG: SUMF1/EgtB/PvdO family nonheme iron enzyme [Planctomycetes bacterium]|nr:SUMF1/EgtB/PvdO family nonheme iron enzyme [Planctomycetota bacterium]
MPSPRLLAALVFVCVVLGCRANRADPTPAPAATGVPPAQPVKSHANYTEKLDGGRVSFDMVAIPGGEFVMGSAELPAEGPLRKVKIRPFWIGKCEVTWGEYDLWSFSKQGVDGVTRPTPPYMDMNFGMGDPAARHRYPAICMTQHAAKTYCAWLSKVTGKHYRLPTEAEWEYACRAGSTTRYSFGDDPARLGEFAWFAGNSTTAGGDREYHQVGTKQPNAWGVHDMHGNVAEWCLDGYARYAPGPVDNPLVEPKSLYPRVTRGGAWSDPPERLLAAARRPSHADWKSQDPQIPKSIWYHTDADFLGFRVVCELPGDAR